MISIEASNAASEFVLKTAFVSGHWALGAALLGSPLGTTGGALLGAMSLFASIPLQKLSHKILNTNHPQASLASKTVAVAIGAFIFFSTAWAALALLGYSLTLWHVVTLGVVGSLISMPSFWFCQIFLNNLNETFD